MKLTKRQKQIAELVAAGYSNKLVAHELHISEHTAVRHMQNIFIRLGVHNRVAMVLRVLEKALGT